MDIVTDYITFESNANCQIFNITDQVNDLINKYRFKEGNVVLSVIGSTASISTIEYEPGLLKDIPNFLDEILPQRSYHHDETWHDGNGHSHLRSFLLKTTQQFIFKDSKLLLGTWQQIIFIDFDNKPRFRKIAVQLIGVR